MYRGYTSAVPHNFLNFPPKSPNSHLSSSAVSMWPNYSMQHRNGCVELRFLGCEICDPVPSLPLKHSGGSENRRPALTQVTHQKTNRFYGTACKHWRSHYFLATAPPRIWSCNIPAFYPLAHALDAVCVVWYVRGEGFMYKHRLNVKMYSVCGWVPSTRSAVQCIYTRHQHQLLYSSLTRFLSLIWLIVV